MTLESALAALRSLGNEKVRTLNIRNGAGENQFGVKLGDIRKLAEKIKTDHQLAMSLWSTGNLDARLLAILVLKPKDLSRRDLDRMVRAADVAQVADWLNAYIVKNHPDKESLRQAWMEDDDPWAARAGWALTSGRVARNPEGLDVSALLDRHPLPGAQKAGDRDRRTARGLSQLSGFQGLHLAVCADLDPRNGGTPIVNQIA